MFKVNGIELVCPLCKGELVVIGGNELFGVLKCGSCGSLYPLGNYFPGIPDLRPKELRIRVFETAWFKTFGIECKQRYGVDVDRRILELPYYIALLKEQYSVEYCSEVERMFLEEFKKTVGEGNVLSIGCGDGRELRLIEKRSLGVDILPSNIILSNSLGVKAILADMFSLPFNEEVFDGVLAIQSLEYVPLRLTHKVLLEIHRILKPSGVILLSLEKSCSGGCDVDKEFNYVYEDEYVKVKKHFHRGWGKEGLKAISRVFKILKLGEDKGYYYVLATKDILQ